MADNAKVSLTGRLVREPKQSTYQGSTVVSFTIAVNTSKKENEKYVADFYNISIWGKPAEFIMPKIQKGSLVHVYGALQLGSYESKSGEKCPSLNVRATEVLPLTGIKTSSENKETSSGDDSGLPF